MLGKSGGGEKKKDPENVVHHWKSIFILSKIACITNSIPPRAPINHVSPLEDACDKPRGRFLFFSLLELTITQTSTPIFHGKPHDRNESRRKAPLIPPAQGAGGDEGRGDCGQKVKSKPGLVKLSWLD
ncbi:hypothetical protein PoB_002199300 [Plakobranchus ocellatus]|uniref:Uncharacterized protein n=1 Tax=Plakobranchus ocellatus TaxID=259542 RepID=A0AAV3ZLM4_9GAST|nr:hypothetical protein PoB_002199300 [Plakobranchus ocellatus]